MKKVITYGTYDMLHVGHINILRRSKDLGDYLIVGVTTEDYDRSRGKLNVVEDLETRVAAVKKLPFVDEVIIEKNKHQKSSDVIKYNIDIFAIGDDWIGKFDYLKDFCRVVYLPRTEGISSTMLRADKLKTIRIGLIGTGRIAKRFAKEALYVPNVTIHAVHSRSISNVDNFAHENGIPYGFDHLDEFLDSGIDAVYIASPHENHFYHAKQSLLAGKHVLCEKPAALQAGQLIELFEIADAHGLIFLEAIKTAFFQAFGKLLSDIEKGKIGDIQEVRASFSKLIPDRTNREWSTPHGGAVNELASYPILLSQKILGTPESHQFLKRTEDGVDAYTTIICRHRHGKFSISSVGIGVKTEGSAIISGTKGYIYIPAPWWLTKSYSIRSEDPTFEQKYTFDLDGDGLRFEISEFATMIIRGERESSRLTRADMLGINSIITSFNEIIINSTPK